MDAKVLKDVVTEAIKPLKDQLAEQGKRIEKVEQAAPAVRTDATGKPVEMGNGQRVDGGPAIVRKDSLGTRPYSLGRIMQAALERDKSLATLEYEVSRKLKNLGFPCSHDGAVLIPMGVD
jgi:hypothetical protein